MSNPTMSNPQIRQEYEAMHTCQHCFALRLPGEARNFVQHRKRQCIFCKGGRMCSPKMREIFTKLNEPFTNVNLLIEIIYF
jgi:hypothetical protein